MLIKQLDKRPKELKGLKPDLIKKAKDYYYDNIHFFINGENLYIKMEGYKVKTEWKKIENFKQYTALDILRNTELGRHFEDGVHELWLNQGLDLGYMLNIFIRKEGLKYE